MVVHDPIRQAQRADADYARLAPVYDEATRWIDLARMTAIDRLAPQPGETVADIACGTGFCLPALVQAVGPAGTVIGIEPSGAMLAHARLRDGGVCQCPSGRVACAERPACLCSGRVAVQLRARRFTIARRTGEHSDAGKTRCARRRGRSEVFPVVARTPKYLVPGRGARICHQLPRVLAAVALAGCVPR